MKFKKNAQLLYMKLYFTALGELTHKHYYSAGF